MGNRKRSGGGERRQRKSPLCKVIDPCHRFNLKVLIQLTDIGTVVIGNHELSGHYEVVFRKEDHVRLRDTLKGIQGKFMVSYNDCALYPCADQDFQIEAVTGSITLHRGMTTEVSSRKC